jgi:hypothetical protein
MGKRRECKGGKECKYGKGSVLELMILKFHPRRTSVQSETM